MGKGISCTCQLPRNVTVTAFLAVRTSHFRLRITGLELPVNTSSSSDTLAASAPDVHIGCTGSQHGAVSIALGIADMATEICQTLLRVLGSWAQGEALAWNFFESIY